MVTPSISTRLWDTTSTDGSAVFGPDDGASVAAGDVVDGVSVVNGVFVAEGAEDTEISVEPAGVSERMQLKYC